MKKIALIRGASLNKWEMQNYEPLMANFELTGFCGIPNFYNIKQIKFPIKKNLCSAKYCKMFPFRIFYGLSVLLFGDYHFMPGLEKRLRKFDLIHTAELVSNYTIAALNSRKKNPKQKVVVTTWENIPFAAEKCKKQIENKKRTIQEADHFLAITERTKECLIVEGVNPDKISVVSMGIDIKKFFPQKKDHELLKKFDLRPDDFIILSIGRSVWEKGFHDVLFASKKLVQKRQNVKLLFVGDGPMHNNLILLSKKLGIFKNTRFVKNVHYDLIPKIHNLADVFVLPSIPIKQWQEQFGMVLIEAMACGKSVISTLSGSIPEVIDHAGILVPPADFYTLAQKLEELYNNPALRKKISNLARLKAEKYFDSSVVAKKIKDIYNSLLYD